MAYCELGLLERLTFACISVNQGLAVCIIIIHGEQHTGHHLHLIDVFILTKNLNS